MGYVSACMVAITVIVYVALDLAGSLAVHGTPTNIIGVLATLTAIALAAYVADDLDGKFTDTPIKLVLAMIGCVIFFLLGMLAFMF